MDIQTPKNEELAAAISTKMFNRVLRRIIPELRPEQQEHLTNLLQTPDGEMEVAKYLEEHVPNIRDIMQEEMTHVENEMATVMDVISIEPEKK